MKNFLKALTLVTLALMLVLSMVACGEKPEKPDDSGIDFSSYPTDFSAWTVNTMQTYLKACGLLDNEEFMLVPMSETDVAPLHAVAGFMYVDATAASVMDIVYAFNPSDADSKATLDGIIANKAIVIGGNPVAQMDAVLVSLHFLT